MSFKTHQSSSLRSHVASILPLQQFDLLVLQILRQLIAMALRPLRQLAVRSVANEIVFAVKIVVEVLRRGNSNIPRVREHLMMELGGIC